MGDSICEQSNQRGSYLYPPFLLLCKFEVECNFYIDALLSCRPYRRFRPEYSFWFGTLLLLDLLFDYLTFQVMRLIELDHLVSVMILPSSQSVEASYPASSLPDGSRLRTILVALFVFSMPFLFNYILLSLLCAIENWLARPGQIPPTYPYVIPFLGGTIPFLWDGINFIRSATYVHAFSEPSLALRVYPAADAFLEATPVNRLQLVFLY